MSDCQRDLIEAGLPYPRTCPTCKLSPTCAKRYPEETELESTPYPDLPAMVTAIELNKTKLASLRDALRVQFEELETILDGMEQAEDAMDVGLDHLRSAVDLLSEQV